MEEAASAAGRAGVGEAVGLCRARAKINLGLIVEGLDQASGYHRLRSLMALLELANDLVVEAPGTADAPEVVAEGDVGAGENLVHKAWRFWRTLAPAEAGLAPRRVRIRKRIPAAAGLGGGSADAAAFLRALLRLPDGKAPPPALLQASGVGVGMDVPFLVLGWPVAEVSGFGERVTPLPLLPRYWVVLANPGIAGPTAGIFAAWDNLPASARRAPGVLPGAELWQGQLPAAPWRNDLEPAARALAPGLAEFRRRLEEAAEGRAVHLSGSGPTFFALCPPGPEGGRSARRLAQRWQETAAWVAVTRLAAGAAGEGEGKA